jgi:glycosyltransferase involved in cell wall biosynthesis
LFIKSGFQRFEDFAQRETRCFLKRNKVQCILGEYLNYSFHYFEVFRELNIPYYTHAHGTDISLCLYDPYWRERYLLYNDAAGIITMSQISRTKLINLGIDSKKIHVIPYGVDVPDYPLQHHVNDVVKCLFVGRLVPKKAPLLLLESFYLALKDYPNLHLDLIGEGMLYQKVEDFVREFGLQDRVTIHGAKPHEFVKQTMQDSHIFIQHSITDPETGDEEGLPVAILEAMANALPVISTRHAGIPEAVIEEETGLLVDEEDTLAMAKNIVLLAEDEQLRRKIGVAAWKRVGTLFTWELERSLLLDLMDLPKD